jgi:hypothetical protein
MRDTLIRYYEANADQTPTDIEQAIMEQKALTELTVPELETLNEQIRR